MSTHTKKLFLLDAMALIYRAHFALSKNPSINSQGINTGATLGFTNALVDIIRRQKPTHIAVAFDKATPTWRHQLYEPYKAQRLSQPEDITLAIPYVKQILEAFRIPVLEFEGYEADDIIGTMACQAAIRITCIYQLFKLPSLLLCRYTQISVARISRVAYRYEGWQHAYE